MGTLSVAPSAPGVCASLKSRRRLAVAQQREPHANFRSSTRASSTAHARASTVISLGATPPWLASGEIATARPELPGLWLVRGQRATGALAFIRWDVLWWRKAER